MLNEKHPSPSVIPVMNQGLINIGDAIKKVSKVGLQKPKTDEFNIFRVLRKSMKFSAKGEPSDRIIVLRELLLTANSIISIAMIIRIIFFLFKINPKIPIKNKNNDRFIV